MKAMMKAIMRFTPYRVVRAGALNRFDAIDDLLFFLRDRGFRPSRIVDGGANIGRFAQVAHKAFPDAAIELIEPQPACRDALGRLHSAHGWPIHPVARVGPTYAMSTISLSVSPGEVSTGAHIAAEPGSSSVEVPAATLDGTLDGRVGRNDRLFVKLDLQGYEMEALAGGERTLLRTEAILTEVSFFSQAYEPPIADLVRFLAARDFGLYDVAALSSRSRDGRARQGDFLFVRRDSSLMADSRWA